MKVRFPILFLLLVAMTGHAHAYYYGGINADALFALKSDNPEGNARGYRTGFTLGYGYTRYFSSLKLGLANENFSGSSDANQKITDIALNLGYRFDPMLSAFVGFRNRSQNLDRTTATPLDARESFSHFGAGVALSRPVAPRWIMKGDAFLYFLSSSYKNKTQSFENSGSGYSAGVSAGFVRTFKDNFNIDLTARLEMSNTQYATGGRYTDVLGGLSVGLAKIF